MKYELIKDKAIRDSIGATVSRYYCTDCATTFLNVDSQPVICPCQKKQPPKQKTNKLNSYFAILNAKSDYVYCVVRTKDASAADYEKRYKLICGYLPDNETDVNIQLISKSASDPNLQDWMNKVEKKKYNTGRRLTPEEKTEIKEQALILFANKFSISKIAEIIGVDRKTIRKIIVI